MKVVVTTNHKKSAEVIVDGNIEGPNEIQFMSFTNCKTVPQNSLWLSKEILGLGTEKRRKGINKVWQQN